MKYETIPQTVEVWQAQADMELIDDTQPRFQYGGQPKVHVKKGQWVVENWNGERFTVMSDREFREKFREIRPTREIDSLPESPTRRVRDLPPPHREPHIWLGPTFVPSEPIKPGTPMCGGDKR